MKTLLTLILASLSFCVSFGQATDKFCDFETPCDMVTIDTSLQDNLWQTGYPAKAVFNLENLSKKIVTDTLTPYGSNNLSIFYVRIIPTGWDFWLDVQFEHIFDTDTLKDGGFIEISVDGGQNWVNIISSPLITGINNYNMYTLSDTLFNGIPGFSGFSGMYHYSAFELELINYDIDTVDFRFCFISDSIDNQRNGWSIDNLYIWGYWEGIDEENKLSYTLSPNPLTSISKLCFENPNSDTFTLAIFDCCGRLIRTQAGIRSNEVTISRSGLSQGIYYFKLYSEHRAWTGGKIMVQ